MPNFPTPEAREIAERYKTGEFSDEDVAYLAEEYVRLIEALDERDGN